LLRSFDGDPRYGVPGIVNTNEQQKQRRAGDHKQGAGLSGQKGQG
jgi:hypothetical protein